MSQRYLGGVITANPTAPTLASASGVWTLEQQFQYAQTIQPERIGNSLRLRASASAYLSRTPATASGYNQWTFSCWVKRGTLGSTQYIIGGNTLTSGGTRNNLNVVFDGTDALQVYAFNNSSGYYFNRVSSALFRDPSAWYHLVVQFDPDNATSANKIIAYVNGQQVAWGTSADSGVAGSITSSAYRSINNTYRNDINGGYQGGGVPVYFGDGYLAECYMVSGMIVPVSSFGAFDSTGVWQPLAYTGTFGTNGFYLDFSDTSALTTASNVGLGKDYSGNGNYWVTNNISITAGTTYDAMIDSPTNYADGGNGRGNYCTLNPLVQRWSQPNVAFSEGNLKATVSSAVNSYCNGTIFPTSGKWYWETTVVSAGGAIGVSDNQLQNTTFTNSVFYNTNGTKDVANVNTAYGSTYTTNDVIGVALDCDGGTVTFYKNNVSQGAITLPSGSVGLSAALYLNNTVHAINFGQRPFSYTPPTGFKALNTQNLPAVTINNGAQYMAATTYTGNGGTQSISNGGNNPTGVTFQPDLVWAKTRVVASSNALFDSVRGATKVLVSNSTVAETNLATNGVTAFNSNGFSVTDDSAGDYYVNGASGGTYSGTPPNYIAWQWKAGGTAVTNTNGSVTSSVSANTTAGFSVVTYTEGGTYTVGHGLGVAPSMIFLKERNAVGNWIVWSNYWAAPTKNGLYLNLTNSSFASGSNWLNSTTSTVFGITGGQVTSGSSQIVAYCFTEVAGFSKFGSYAGNSSTDGPFVYCGFRPRWLLIKSATAAGTWTLWDSSRSTANSTNLTLAPNSSAVESSGINIDFLSNGFKVRHVGDINVSGVTSIYAAFAENPFTIARAR